MFTGKRYADLRITNEGKNFNIENLIFAEKS